MNPVRVIAEFLKLWKLILELAKKDLITRYLGSYLGILWGFIQPAVLILIFWFVFQVGFKSIPVENFPFILWLICGISPWYFFSDAINMGTYAIEHNSYLVKKIVFKVSILPIIKNISALFIHLFYIIIIFILFAAYGYKPSVYNIQLLYYLTCLFFLAVALCYITSSVLIFLKDVGQIVGMFLQFGFWLTPIFWSFDILPEKYQFYFKLNPLYYIIEGYRDTFIHHVWFWEHPFLTAYFWVLLAIIFALAIIVFKKLKPHFADVL
ncbi:ABC transporter permease [Paenibacillus sp. YN15]|nr:ABC transporter permease [Paenibacillus sp. YN15]